MGVINYSKILRKNLQALDAPEKTYAVAQSRGRMDTDALAKHMSDHNSPYSRGLIKGVLDDFVDCVRELITDGWIIDLGLVGTFGVKVKSRGVSESEVDEKTGLKPVFSAADITSVFCHFVPGIGLKNLRQSVTLHEVLTREEQKKAIKAKAAGIAEGSGEEEDNG